MFKCSTLTRSHLCGGRLSQGCDADAQDLHLIIWTLQCGIIWDTADLPKGKLRCKRNHGSKYKIECPPWKWTLQLLATISTAHISNEFKCSHFLEWPLINYINHVVYERGLVGIGNSTNVNPMRVPPVSSAINFFESDWLWIPETMRMIMMDIFAWVMDWLPISGTRDFWLIPDLSCVLSSDRSRDASLTLHACEAWIWTAITQHGHQLTSQAKMVTK